MSPPLSVIFLGSDPIALPLLDWLAGEGAALAAVTAVCTQPDRPAGRGQQVAAGPIKRWAEARGLPVRQPERLTADDTAWLAARQPDVALVMAYGHLLGDELIATPRLGTLNLHASLLPKFRGASPIQTAIAAGERETGVTLMRVVRRMDAGPVADRKRVAIGPLDAAPEVEARLARACVPLLARALPRLRAGTLEFAVQDESRASYCRRLTKADGRLDFAAPAAVLAARINGLYPWPGCAVEADGLPIRLGLAEAVADSAKAGHPPGTVIGADGAGLLVATGAGRLRLRRLQRPGGRMLPAPEFLRGLAVPAGSVLPSHPMTVLTGPTPLR